MLMFTFRYSKKIDVFIWFVWRSSLASMFKLSDIVLNRALSSVLEGLLEITRTVFLKWDFHLCVNKNLLKSFLLNIFESLSSLYHGNYLLLYQNQPIKSSINQSFSQPTNQSINQSINWHTINQSIQSTNWEINQPTNQLINHSICQPIDL